MEGAGSAAAQQHRILEMRGIVKSYGAVCANAGIDLDVEAGQIVGLLGENGSGKSTLMKVLFGMVKPDAGGIVYKGQEFSGHDPKAALAAGIAMIHQHFMLVEAMTVAENVMLGWDAAGRWLKRAAVAAAVRETSARFGLDLDPQARVGELSLGRRQRVEILKALMRGVDLLILDEPTSNLTPSEVAGLFGVLRQLRAERKGVVLITHKLHEILDVTDVVVVLRDGRVSGRRLTRDATARDLARMMVERDVTTALSRAEARHEGAPLLSVSHLTVSGSAEDGLRDVSFDLCPGEVLAIAGIDGNGQSALVETLAGLRRPKAGRIWLLGRDITKASVAQRVEAGLAYIPADRSTTSLVQGMTIAENLALRDIRRAPFSLMSWLRRRGIDSEARRRIRDFAIRTSGPTAAARDLSGGNQQKIVVAREMARRPRVLIAFQATWGLDPGAARFVHDQIMAMRNAGHAVLYVASELEEVLSLGDRIGVLYAGRLVAIVPRGDVDRREIGLFMAGHISDRAAA
jgi:simple sugar transport system ATP-binding protein